MKFLCSCGHVIRDQTDYLPYKAMVVRDQDYERFWDAVVQLIADGLAHPKSGAAADWFGFRPSSVRKFRVSAYECESCGRLYVERQPEGEFVEYLPASGNVERVLASPHGAPDP